MARDEAIEINTQTIMREAEIVHSLVSRSEIKMLATCGVDRFVALGMLKLDEPMSVRELARDVIEREVTEWNMVRSGSIQATDVSISMLAAFKHAGLKIVEK